MAETQPTEKEGFTVSSSTCKRYFGYLGQRSKGEAMPDDCLTCDRMIDCMYSKTQAPPVKTEPKPEPEIPKKVEEQTFTPVMAEEQVVFDEAEIIEAEIQAEKQEEPVATVEQLKPIEAEEPPKKPLAKRLDGDFVVESPGQLYSQWSSTVLVNKETLDSFGKNIKEVYVQSREGIRVKCKVYAVPDLEHWTIQIPNKLKAELEIRNGDYVKVTPK